MTRWTPAQLPDLSGRTFVITGASSGIGLSTARSLAGRGGNVIAAVRNPDKARDVIDFDADIRHLDLADLESVRTFAAELDGPVDVLINNAGVMAPPLGRTKQGFELQIGTNHLGHFTLTGLLLNQVTDRVLTVSSTAHRTGRIDLDDLNWNTRDYQRWPAYGQSKLANLLFTSELQRRLSATGSSVIAVAAHPGYSNTNLQSHTESRIQDGFMRLTNRLLAQSGEQGSWPSLYASVADVPGDSFIGPDGWAEIRGHPKQVGRSARASDEVTAARLWDLSESLTDVAYRFS